MTNPTTDITILDDDAIREIEARASAATPGPWKVFSDSRPDIVTTAEVNSGYMGERHLFSMDKYGHSWGQSFENEDDAEFIAHARADIPALCQTVRVLRAENEKLNTDVARFSTLADERHDLLSAERRANDDLRAERSKILESLERAQQERNRLGTGLANLYHVITGRTCDKHVALGMATSAVSSLQSQLEQVTKERDDMRQRILELETEIDTKRGYL